MVGKSSFHTVWLANLPFTLHRISCKGGFPFRVFSRAGGKFLRDFFNCSNCFESAQIFFKEPIRFHAKKPAQEKYSEWKTAFTASKCYLLGAICFMRITLLIGWLYVYVQVVSKLLWLLPCCISR